MRYAVIENATGLVRNVIVLDDDAPWRVPRGHSLIEAASAGSPGDTWDGTQFVPEPERVPSAKELRLEELRAKRGARTMTLPELQEYLELLDL
jgi:hypothetical protein